MDEVLRKLAEWLSWLKMVKLVKLAENCKVAFEMRAMEKK